MKLNFFLLAVVILAPNYATEEKSIDELLDEARALDVNKDERKNRKAQSIYSKLEIVEGDIETSPNTANESLEDID